MLAAVYRNRGRFRERDRAAVYLSRVDSKLAALRHALRQIRAAGTLSANASELVAWARDTALPLAVRRELVLAVAFGWAYNDHETRSGAAESRKEGARRARSWRAAAGVRERRADRDGGLRF